MAAGFVALTVVVIVGAAADARQAQRETRERGVVVGVVGSGNTPVPGLTTADFAVREDGVAREVLRVGVAPPPSHLVLLVDDSQAAADAVLYLRTALVSFVRRMMSGDRAPEVAFWTFGDRPTRRADFSPNSAQVDRAIERLFVLNGSGAYFLEALAEVSRELKKRKAERPMIVAFVDEDGPEFSSLTHKNVAEALRGAGVSLWTVTNQTKGQAMGTSEARERALVLGDVTAWSGGVNTVVITPQALDTTLASLASQIANRYLVTYGRPESLVPPDRIDVEVKRRDVRVRVTRWAVE